MQLLLVLLAVAVTCFSGSTGSVAQLARRHGQYICPNMFIKHGNSCYYLSRHMAAWHEAHYNCKDMGSDLARLEKKWEDKNMRAYLNKPELARLERWIGGIYNWGSHRWTWGATGQPLVYQGFTRRRAGDNPTWHCIILDPSMAYKWRSRNCSSRKHYICETPLTRIKPPQPIATITTNKIEKERGRGRGRGRGQGKGRGRGWRRRTTTTLAPNWLFK